MIGTRGALRLFGPSSLGLAGFVSPDQLLRLPDFRAGERMFSLMWAAAERVGAHGSLVIQSQNPSHYAIDAVARQDLGGFYRPELKFRAELGYPPFRRLALLTISATAAAETRRVADEVAAALRASSRLTVYPPVADRRDRARRIVVKGHARPSGRAGAGAGGLPGTAPAEPRYHRRGGGSGRMAVLKVRRYGDPVLRRRAEEIATVTPQIRRLAEDMIETMYHQVGIGLAAPQIGAVAPHAGGGRRQGAARRRLVNPVITEQRRRRHREEEGCLSLPGIFARGRAQQVGAQSGGAGRGRPAGIARGARGLRARDRSSTRSTTSTACSSSIGCPR